jgi:hypothetical protein
VLHLINVFGEMEVRITSGFCGLAILWCPGSTNVFDLAERGQLLVSPSVAGGASGSTMILLRESD